MSIAKGMTGADPGFFLGGGAPLRNGVTDVIMGGGGGRQIPVVLESRRSSQGGGGAHPLHPTP